MFPFWPRRRSHPWQDTIPTCLKITPPIIFHGVYSLYDQTQVEIDPLSAPMIDAAVWAHADCYESQLIYDSTLPSEAKQRLRSGTEQMLQGKVGRCKGWKLYEVTVGKQNLSLKFVHEEGGELASLVLGYDIKQEVHLIFRVFQSEMQGTNHKLFFRLQPDPVYGRVLKVAEWRRGSPISIVTSFLDIEETLLDDLFGLDEDAVNALFGTPFRRDPEEEAAPAPSKSPAEIATENGLLIVK